MHFGGAIIKLKETHKNMVDLRYRGYFPSGYIVIVYFPMYLETPNSLPKKQTVAKIVLVSCNVFFWGEGYCMVKQMDY